MSGAIFPQGHAVQRFAVAECGEVRRYFVGIIAAPSVQASVQKRDRPSG